MPDLTQQILNLRQGDHLCLFYERDPAEQMPALVPFIHDALQQNERFINVADDQSTDELATRLESAGINVGREIKRGRLQLWSREWQAKGEHSAEEKSLQVRRILEESKASGFTGTRFAVEMTWTLGPEIHVKALEQWEAGVNSLFMPGTPGRIICQYNRQRLSPEVLLTALHTHPLAIVGDEVHPNIFYQPPFLLSGDAKSDAVAHVNWMIGQLKRSRKDERQHEDTAAQQLAAIVAGSNDAIFSMTLGGVIKSWNDGAERLYGYRAEEIIGQHLKKLVPDAVHGDEIEILARTRQGERIDHYETIRQRKDGRIIHISLTVSPIVDRNGRVVGISKIARDISDRIRAEEILLRENQELADLDTKKDEFLAMLGHELRNPLAALQNATRLLSEESDDSAKHWAEGVLKRQVDMLARLVDDLVDVSRITRGRVELRRDNLDLRPIIRRAVETVRPLIMERRHTIELSIPEENLPVSADSARLEQVLMNLITNAAKYTDPGGLIELSAKRTGGKILVSIKDNGIGIAPDLLAHVFELFVQDTRGLDRSQGGLGIGLAVAKRLVEMHGGILTARSEGPGKGSEFTLSLPESAEQACSQKHPSVPTEDGKDSTAVPGRRILLVDDNFDSATTFTRLLQRRGHVVEVVHDGPSALARAEYLQPDTFLLDLGLPGMDGYELAAELQRRGFVDALFVAISGYAQRDDFERSRRAGFHHHLVKPAGIDRIVEIFQSFKALAPAGQSQAELSRS